MRWSKAKRVFSLFLAVLMLQMAVLPALPNHLLQSWAFGLVFANSGSAGHPYIKGRVNGTGASTWFLCLDHGASAHSDYDYSKEDHDIDYANGSQWEKELFWAYIMAFGSYDGEPSMEIYKNMISKDQARQVAWKQGTPESVTRRVDGFLELSTVPAGCKSAEDIYRTVSSYGSPETALGIHALQSAPNVIDAEKLYHIAGLDSMSSFNKYCRMDVVQPAGGRWTDLSSGMEYVVQIVKDDTGDLRLGYRSGDGVVTAVPQNAPQIIVKVSYDQSIWSIRKITGRIEYFKCNIPGSQRLARVKGKEDVMPVAFYLTTGSEYMPSTGSAGGGREGGEGISYKVYEHTEIFESNYKVDLTKRDYETGNPLKGSVWQCLEAFPDQVKLGDTEADGGLRQENMREEPVVWPDWLVFEEDMTTDENGLISHQDTRYYDFRQAYCNGHPLPPEPEEGEDEESAGSEEEDLTAEWQAQVDACEEKARSYTEGTFHHWLCDSESEPSEEEAFEQSGLKANRDAAYENFINLRYSYTFRETRARDGYILHGQNGHPDDVPLEIITTASSEAEKEREWTACSNEDIRVTGHVNNMTFVKTEEGESEAETENWNAAETSDDANSSREKLYLTETYDLSLGQKLANLLCGFFGLPEKYASKYQYTVNVTARDYAVATASDMATVSNADEPLDDIELINDLASPSSMTVWETATAANAVYYADNSSDYQPISGTKEEHRETPRLRRLEEEKEEGNFDSATGDSQPSAEPGPDDRILHSWIVYDHRVPGQIHINKRDMELKAGEGTGYDSYGDSQGDGVLEGAVYGLFAADDIYHPDTQRESDGSVKKGSGILFDANDLVAVAATDKNGDASFMAITEIPHSIYSYSEGKILVSGKAYPKNLYNADIYRKEYDAEENGRIYENYEAKNGSCWIGRPLILGSYYVKELTRSEGYELSITGKDMSVTNTDDAGRDQYGETEDSMSHPNGMAWVTEQLQYASTFPEANETYGNKNHLLYFEIGSVNTAKGYDVAVEGIPEDADFYYDNVTVAPVKIQVPVNGRWENASEEPFYETAASEYEIKRDQEGNPILNKDAVPTLPAVLTDYAYPAQKLEAGKKAVPADVDQYVEKYADTEENNRYIKYEFEQMFRQLGGETPKDGDRYSTENHPVYDEPKDGTYGSPEVQVKAANVTTNGSMIETLLDYFLANRIFTYGSIQSIEQNGNAWEITLAVSVLPEKRTLYETDENGDIAAVYTHKLNEQTGRYVVRKYTGESIAVDPLIGESRRRKVYLTPDFIVNEEGLPVDRMEFENEYDQYLHYDAGDILYDYWYQDGAGEWIGHEPVPRKVYIYDYEEQTVEESHVNASKIPLVKAREDVLDPDGSTYVIWDGTSGQYTLHVGSKDADLSGKRVSSFTIAVNGEKQTVTAEDLKKIGSHNVWEIQEGDQLLYSEYLIRIQGAGVGAFTGTRFHSGSSYIRNKNLIYGGGHDLAEDGGTAAAPLSVEERMITQQIKVAKTVEKTSYNHTNSYSDVHEDWWTKWFGGFGGERRPADKLDNFRFKTYLKSNLEALYRDEDGTVIWQDRKGKERSDAEQLAANKAYPALVNQINTKVLHRTEPLYQDSRDAVEANTELYGYADGLIREEQNKGYTRILETIERQMEDGAGTRTVMAYNYDKFFDGIAAANHDKWDDGAPSYTSWRPLGNEANKTWEAVENTKVSDKVRQFAIDWYLEDEAAKLLKQVPGSQGELERKDGVSAYTDELYDRALYQAILKAENYLKPFFLYDLDEIYAVRWDGETGGGSDGDETTVSADTLSKAGGSDKAGCYFGTSAYLPYGTYVVVEQQPRYAELGDFKNKHYEIDQPREIALPALYDGEEDAWPRPEAMAGDYNYRADISQEEMEQKYKIRFNEEPVHVIYGRNAAGGFEVYKYGAEIAALDNGNEVNGEGHYYALTQSEFRPYKNYYNQQDDRTAAAVTYYLSEAMSGRAETAQVYRYSSVSEHGGTADDVPYLGGEKTDDNALGVEYRDQVRTMHGSQTAYDGKYAAMLVPWSVKAADGSEAEGSAADQKSRGDDSFHGFGLLNFRNRFYRAKLRLEKLDSETHENILHDGALFWIYAAKRDDSADGDGTVLFYEKDTVISGTREFLEAMGASDITPMKRELSWLDRLLGKEAEAEKLCIGTVPAGTPVCEESEQIVLGDGYGEKTGAFKVYSTVRDGLMREETADAGAAYQQQTVGYLETPQPLGAGVYVLCEAKAPSGYARSKPIALELYSDKVTYYKEGNQDSRGVAAVYETLADQQTENGNKPQDRLSMARIHVENAPIQLKVEKLKETAEDSAQTVTYKVSGRIDGSLAEIGNNPDYVYAYDQDEYLGYAWKKGTLEALKARKEAGEQVELVYHGSNFAGYGYVTRTLETADDPNPYVVGATMTLFDALELTASGDTEDHAWNGLVIERNSTNNVVRMYVKQGFAGTKIEFVKEKDENGQERIAPYQAGVDKNGNVLTKTGNIWTAQTVERPDTDILYYDLDSLDIIGSEKADGRTILYGYDHNYRKIPIDQLEDDKQNHNKTDREHSLFAFKNGVAYLELVGGDFTKVRYFPKDKVLTVDQDTRVYHLDQDGNRDALVDPYTGMAYVTEPLENGEERILVWPVLIDRDEYGNVIARDKITTSRIATVGENQLYDLPVESGYITGSWKSEDGEESHLEISVRQNELGQNMNEESLLDDHNGSFQKELNPIYDGYGLAEYYQSSDESYDKSTDLYDRNGDFVRQKDSDNLEEYNNAAYAIKDHENLYDGEADVERQERTALRHRQGEGYILENTWITSDKTPNDPFQSQMTNGQPDIIKRLPAGHYIMEELKSPAGYIKGMPTTVTVEETAALQEVTMTDKTTKTEFGKQDAPAKREVKILDRMNGDRALGTSKEPLSAFGYGMVQGAVLGLFPAKRVYTRDTKHYPKGHYLKKESSQPVRYFSTAHTLGEPDERTAQWTSGRIPEYAEGIPEGFYVLEELRTPDGFVTAEPLEVEIKNTPEVQVFTMPDDHTRVEIEKYTADGAEEQLLAGAEFSLYEAKTGKDGNILMEDGEPLYYENRKIGAFVSGDGTKYRNFMPAFEKMYQEYGTSAGTSVSWEEGADAYRAVYVSCEQTDASDGGGNQGIWPDSAVMLFQTDDGAYIRIGIHGKGDDAGGQRFTFEYQFEYQKLFGVNDYACMYQTVEGRQRLEYLPAGGKYALVEAAAPEGYAKAKTTAIEVLNTEHVQRYRIENQEGSLWISKWAKDREGELAGARLGLYRPDASGGCTMTEEYKVTEWITGEDGTYTELDFINGRIPEGYKQGDLRPHRIRRLPDGEYWLAELKSPEYYTAFEPVLIFYRQEEHIRLIRVTDQPVEGSLCLKKTDLSGRFLPGAVFELSVYEDQAHKKLVFVRSVSGTEEETWIRGLPVGKMQEDGSIAPYWYCLREVTPPDGYAASEETVEWQFAANRQGISYGPGESAVHRAEVKNDRTRISIGKADFDAMADSGWGDAWVNGAKLAVYAAVGRDEEGRLDYDENQELFSWTTSMEEPVHVLEGLIAGRSYVLKEKAAPDGYHVMEPIVFTLSADGRKIVSFGSAKNLITVNYRENENSAASEVSGDGIQSVTIQGRYAVKTIYQTESVAEQEGAVRTITEKTVYSDGSEELSRRITRVIDPNEPEVSEPETRGVEKTELVLEDEDGMVLGEFCLKEGRQESAIWNDGVFQTGKTIVLREFTFYSDGECRESSRFAFTFYDKHGGGQILATDRKSKAVLSKRAITGREELPGCHMTLTDVEGREIESWISGQKPHEITGVLTPGETYILRERQPADGYCSAEEIRFQMNEEGVPEQVIMRDAPVRVQIEKVDQRTGKPLAGAVFEILKPDGEKLDRWTSDGSPHILEAVLKAGETYVLRELRAPSGYKPMEDLTFTAPENSELLVLTCENRRKPDTDTPEEENPPKKFRIGRITASYKPSDPQAEGMMMAADGRIRRTIPATGDSRKTIAYGILFFLSLGGMILLRRRKKKL